jgi:hypothetical protein
MMPVAWCQEYQGEGGKASRVVCTTMGASQDLESAGLRRFLINACFWGLGMESEITPDLNVDYVSPYKPTPFGFGSHQKGLKPADFAVDAVQSSK